MPNVKMIGSKMHVCEFQIIGINMHPVYYYYGRGRLKLEAH